MTATQTRTIDLTLTISVPPSGQPTVAVRPAASSEVVAPAPIKMVCDKELHRVNLEGFLRAQVGRFVGLDFVKLDGSPRTLNGRLGVQKHLKGGVNNVQADDRPYLVIYCVKSKGYRTVNLATVNVVRAQNTRFHVIG